MHLLAEETRNSMGTPAIVYPVGGLVDSTVDGQTGMVTGEETPAAVADSLMAALKRTPEDYQRLRLNAWNRSKTFQWQQVLPKACEWLESHAK